MRKVKTSWLLVEKGKPHPKGLADLDVYQKGRGNLIETQFFESSPLINISGLSKEQIEAKIMEYYNHLVASKVYTPGAYGDWIKVSFMGKNKPKYAIVDLVGERAWFKPAIAADLGIFIKSQSKYFFIGVIRGTPPVENTPAIVGGMLHASREFESGIHAALREASEETGLNVKYDGNWEDLKLDYMKTSISVQVMNLSSISSQINMVPGRIDFITTMKTPEIERRPNGLKRVYITHAYTLFLQTD